MPKRTDIKRVLVIGSGPIVIGQAAEFDYSGTQACKALRAEGLEVVLVNSNPATIMTDPELADATYIEPLTPEMVEAIIAKERPDAVLPTVGGQTALNLAVALHERGILEQVQRQADWRVDRRDQGGRGPPAVPQRDAGDRRRGAAAAASPRSLEEALALVEDTGFPAIIRPSFTLGGVGGGIAYNIEEFRELAGRGARPEPGARDPRRGVGHRLEGIRARGDARRRRQLRRHLLDREHRSDGRAHRRLDHRRAGADADRQGIPADARHGPPHHPPRRRRDRRLEHPVRHQPRTTAASSPSR